MATHFKSSDGWASSPADSGGSTHEKAQGDTGQAPHSVSPPKIHEEEPEMLPLLDSKARSSSTPADSRTGTSKVSDLQRFC